VSGLPLLIFDGDCAFCSSSVRWGERHIRRMPAAQPYQFTDLEPFGLTADECNLAVQYVEPDGRVHSAEDAVSALLVDAGKGWRVLGRAMRLPGLHWLSGVIYRWVARNRSRLPGGTAACAIPRRP
jgi:predicted DCC family thiol-disulfide oxidoreductase YuxK